MLLAERIRASQEAHMKKKLAIVFPHLHMGMVTAGGEGHTLPTSAAHKTFSLVT